MDQAIDTLRAVPPEFQDDLARTIMRLAGKDQPVFTLTPEEHADLAAAEEEEARGEFATDDEMRAIWMKHGL